VGVLTMPNLRARSLRNSATDAERKLWQELRMLRHEDRHFRRQVPLGTYVADFACHSCKLVVELDGGQHNGGGAILKDAQRTDELGHHGFRVMRFWNTDVFNNLEGVVDMIRNACGLETTFEYREASGGVTPTPDPSPQGGGE
jgi:very-short-patch-repair endonuclease